LRLEGSHKIDAPRERVFAALIDPATLEKCIPGLEEMVQTGDNQFSAKLTAGVGAIKGVFSATISVEDVSAPEHYKLVVEGKGKPGFVKGSGEFDLADDDGGTSIRYTGDVHAGGLLASVGQRMIQATGKMLATKFFKAVATETGGTLGEEDGAENGAEDGEAQEAVMDEGQETETGGTQETG